jgi:hypothetical protein
MKNDEFGGGSSKSLSAAPPRGTQLLLKRKQQRAKIKPISSHFLIFKGTV